MQKQKGISTLIGIIIIIAVALVLFGSVFAYQYFFVKPQNSEFLVSRQKTDQIAGWQTYKNAKYGIEFKYPKGLFDGISPEIISSCTTVDQEKPRAQLFFGNYDNGLDSNTMGIYIPCNIVDENTLAQNTKIEKITTTRIGGRSAYAYSYTDDNTNQGLGGYRINKNFVVPFDEYSLRIDFSSGYDVSSRPKIVEGNLISQILATFKFIPQINQTAGWQTYTDSTFPFSLSYPSDFALASNLTTSQQRQVGSYMGACPVGSAYKELNEIGFCYIGNKTADGFEAAALDIIPNISTSIQDCQKTQQNNNGQFTSRQTVNGVIFYKDNLADAGLGHYQSIDSYRTYYKGACYTINLKIDSDRGTLEQGLSTDFVSIMRSKLESIISTFKFTK
jgi:hypothetical protein